MAQFTPAEEQDIIRRYNAALAAGIPINVRLAKDFRDVEVGIKGYSDALEQRAKELKSAFGNMFTNVTDGTQGLSGYSEATQASFNALGTWAEKLPLVGKAAKLLSESAGKYFTAVEKQADVQFKSYQELSRSGLAVGMGDTFKNLQAAGYTVAEIGQFTNLVKENSTTLAMMGGTAAAGLKGFADVNYALTTSDLLTQFGNMGMSLTDISESQINYIKFSQLTGSSKIKTTKELRDSTKKYIEKQDQLAKITGLNAAQQNEAYEKALRMEQYNFMQTKLQSKIDTGSPEEAAAAQKELDRNKDLITMVTGAGGGEDADAIGLLLAGAVNDPRYKKAAMAYPEMSRAIAAGEMSAGKLMNLVTKDARKIASENQDRAKFGGFEDQMGSYSAKAKLAANSLKDYTQVQISATNKQGKQKTGEEDPNTADMVMVHINLRDAAQSTDEFVNLGVGPATTALRAISRLKQQTMGVAGELAGKEGQLGGGTTALDKGKNVVNSAADTAKNVANSVIDTVKESLASTATFGISDSTRFVKYAQKVEKENAAAKDVPKVTPLKKYDVGGYTGDPDTYVASSAPPAAPSMTATELAAKILSNKALVKEVKTETTDDTASAMVPDTVMDSTNTEGYKQYLQSLSFKSNPTNTIDAATQAKQFIEQQGALAKSPPVATEVNDSNLGMDGYDSRATTNFNVSKIPSLGRMTAASDKSGTAITSLTTGLSNNLQNNTKDSATVSPIVNDTGYTQSQQPLPTTVTNKTDNVTDMGVVSEQVKKTLDTYNQLAQSGNFEKLFGKLPPTFSANNKPSIDNNTKPVENTKTTATAYGDLAKTGNFDNNLGSFKEMTSTVSGTGSSTVSSTSDKFSQVFNIFPQLVNLFSKIGQSQNDFTNINILNIKDQLSNQQLMEQDAKKNLELVSKQQNTIGDITNNLVTKGITPTQKSFKILKDMLELRSESSGARTLSSGGGTGAMGGMRPQQNRRKSSSMGGSSSGGGSSGGGSSGGGTSGETSGGSAGSVGSSGSMGSSGSTGSSSSGVAESTPSGSPPTGTAANAAKLNIGSAGSVAGGTAETEKAGGLAAGTGPTTVGQNQQLFLQAMTDLGVTDPKVRAAMAASAEGESGFKMQSEIGYENTSNENIRKSFGMGSVFGKMPDEELTKIKADPAKFFDYVYGGRFGNNQPGDGWKYRGRGFIGITFKGNYKQYGERLGIDLVGNPELANDPKIASKIGVMMMLDGMKKSPGADPYTQVARSIGNPNAVTEQRKKDAYARNMQTGEFGADKVADLSSLTKGGAATQTAAATAPLQTAQAEIPAAPAGQKMQSAQLGGILTGSPSGYQAMLHGDEAVVPLPDGKSIPLEMPEQDDGSDQLVALLSAKCQKLGKLIDQMSKHAEMSRKLLQLQS